MSAVLDNAAQQIQHALSRYDVGELQEFQIASHGIENANYFIKTKADDGRIRNFVLTFIQQTSNAGHLYPRMMGALVDQGLPVAPPLQPRDEASDAILLQPRLSGSHTINPTQKQIEALGRFTARMHLCMARTDITLPAYPRTPAWLHSETDEWLNHIPFADRHLLTESINKVTTLLARADVQALPSGMIHGDLFRDNVLFNERGLTGVLDFHHAATGPWLFDLSVIANDWCTDNQGGLDPDRTQALLSAYHHLRPLTEQELWFFSGFALYASLCFWVSRLTVSLKAKTEHGVRTKNPEEFKRILAHHLRHPIYLDPRLLDVKR